MKISVRWLNEYLEPGDVTAQEAERALTFAGFPIESAETLPSGDTCLDVEVTSNRGDVLSHVGVARELAAATGRRLRLPPAGKAFGWFGEGDAGSVPPPAGSADVGSVAAVDNRAAPVGCPLFTARVIRGVAVGPSPRWMQHALESVGLRPINNVVDVTNFVAFEYGQPTHVFDLDLVARGKDGKARLIVRTALKGEKLALLDGRTVTLAGDELVVADEGEGGEGGAGGRAISLAGVMGGEGSGVTGRTVDVLLEAATWAPGDVRRTARRFGIRTDASYRFERVVDARTIEVAARRAAALIVKLAGGKLLPGVIHAGVEPAPPAQVRLRPARCRLIMGENVPLPEMQRVLEAYEIGVRPTPGAEPVGEPVLVCTIPAHRPDLEREIDLIEEVARTHGLDKLPVHEKVPVRVAPPQLSEAAVRAAGAVLNGLGFFEAITFTFVSPKAAKPFVPAGLATLEVCDDRRAADPVLRPSAVPSLLACRRANQDRGADAEGGVGAGGVRLYEVSSVFAQEPSAEKGGRGREVERVNLALVADCALPEGGKQHEVRQTGVRLVRGAVESVVRALGGEAATVEIVPEDRPHAAAYDAGAYGAVMINGRRAGFVGLLSAATQSGFGLAAPVAAAEIELAALVALYPPRSTVRTLPSFPAIERDLSLIVPEATRWAEIDRLVGGLGVGRLESWRFVTAYRGPQAGAGKKSVTFRMRFRDPARTLTHDEVSPQVETIAEAAKAKLGAEVRTA